MWAIGSNRQFPSLFYCIQSNRHARNPLQQHLNFFPRNFFFKHDLFQHGYFFFGKHWIIQTAFCFNLQRVTLIASHKVTIIILFWMNFLSRIFLGPCIYFNAISPCKLIIFWNTQFVFNIGWREFLFVWFLIFSGFWFFGSFISVDIFVFKVVLFFLFGLFFPMICNLS